MEGMLNDIVERFDDNDNLDDQAGFAPPAAPSGKPGGLAFPKASSKKFSSWRERKDQRDKLQQTVGGRLNATAGAGGADTLEDSKIAKALRRAKQGQPGREFSESERIHIENLEALAKMTPEEVERERNELLSLMDEGVLRKLLKRATDREQNNDGMLDDDEVDRALGVTVPEKKMSEKKPETKKTVAFDLDENGDEIEEEDPNYSAFEKKNREDKKRALGNFSIADVGVEGLNNDDDNRYPSFEELQRIQSEMDEQQDWAEQQQKMNVHFPKSRDPELDPHDPDFAAKLHDKYFPSLPSEPEKMEWMRDNTSSENAERAYTEARDSFLPRELRFDFKGELLSPRQSQAIPTTAGLHHHGDQPDAAGYTVPELAHLARSTVPSQRAMAIQTLGRVLFRLGKGKYGPEIGAGLWGLVDEARVIDTLTEASDERATRSMTVRACAVDALWLWRQGGGGRPAV